MADGTALLGAFVASCGLVFGLYQYLMNSRAAEKARMRERAVKAADELENFYRDDDVKLALRIMEYETLEVPFQARPSGSQLSSVRVNRKVLVEALQHQSVRYEKGYDEEKGEIYSGVEIQIRETFDSFLFRLDRVQNLIRNEVISKADFHALFSYWLELMGEIPMPADQITHFCDERRRALWMYIRQYQFEGVVRLFEAYGRAAPVGTLPERAFVSRKVLSNWTLRTTPF
jgi:hypothetical protein